MQRTGAKVFRNDEHGYVIVTSEEGKVDVAGKKPEAAFLRIGDAIALAGPGAHALK